MKLEFCQASPLDAVQVVVMIPTLGLGAKTIKGSVVLAEIRAPLLRSWPLFKKKTVAWLWSSVTKPLVVM